MGMGLQVSRARLVEFVRQGQKNRPVTKARASRRQNFKHTQIPIRIVTFTSLNPFRIVSPPRPKLSQPVERS